MEAFWGLLNGLGIALQPLPLLAVVAGVLIGVVAGALPGISFVNAMAICLPFTLLMSPLLAMMFLGGTPLDRDPRKAPPNHSNRVWFDEDTMVQGIALYAGVALDHCQPSR